MLFFFFSHIVFILEPKRELPPVYGLDATDVENWKENVLKPATGIIQSLLEVIFF